jgi:serine/threonine protein kinase
MSPNVFDLKKYHRTCFQKEVDEPRATEDLSSYLRTIITNYTPSRLIDSSGYYMYKNGDNVVNFFIVVSEKYKIGGGTYGNIYKCRKNESSILVKIQKSAAKINALAESLIQWACYWVLEAYGLKWAIPRVYDIIEHPSYGVIFTMEEIVDGVLFGNYLSDNIDTHIASKANDIIILETIAQLALYILLLEKTLGLWHRDLKANNILMVRKEAIKDLEIRIDEHTTVILNSKYQTIMVDFGCSSIEGLTVNSNFPTIENYKDCGRDLFIIFSNIMNNYRIRQSFTLKTWDLFKKWLVYKDGSGSKQFNWISVLLHDEDPYLERAYNTVNKPSFNAPNAVPLAVLKDIAAVYPSIVRLAS